MPSHYFWASPVLVRARPKIVGVCFSEQPRNSLEIVLNETIYLKNWELCTYFDGFAPGQVILATKISFWTVSNLIRFMDNSKKEIITLAGPNCMHLS